MKDYKSKILIRFSYWVALCLLMAFAILGTALKKMTLESDYWQRLAERYVRENVPIPATRGNILSSDNKLLASSLPEYRLYIDFCAGGGIADTLIGNHLTEVCKGLNSVLPDYSVAKFRQVIQKGRRKKSKHHLIYPYKISYNTLKRVQELPIFDQGPNRSGLHFQEFNQRKTIFGSLAAQTLGRVYPEKELGARSGIELAFDSLLRGRDGISHRQKVLNRFIPIVDKPAVDGCDITTTIDIDMQDICQNALMEKLREIEAQVGVVILMDVKSGDVKAIVNLSRGNDGNYYENNSHAISDLLEPGSTFKTASIMAALDEGLISPDASVDVGNGLKMMYGRAMKDHNYGRGGYGLIDLTHIMMYSSNIGVSTLVDESYRKDPQKFVEKLRKMGLGHRLNLQIQGEGTPVILGPKEKKGFWKTDLPWMSIGYALQIAPIHLVTFYNAIANDGVMVKPRFVKDARRGGKVVEEYPVEVINPKICSESTLKVIRNILQKVVSDGTGKKASAKEFNVSGKTGTAQIWLGGSRTHRHLVSFCGYFPSENPKYTCVVEIQTSGGIAGGGMTAAPVFSKIAEKVYAKDIQYKLEQAIDSTTNVIPQVYCGDGKAAAKVLDALDIPYKMEKTGNIWASSAEENHEVRFSPLQMADKRVPDVRGMGAKDAVYLLESCGLRVNLTGAGKVVSQSVPAGNRVVRGATVRITLK